jgi:glycosyltransferase involved in cell wall biosynthesis
MTVWNCEAFLAEAIDSVLAQTTSEAWELIVVDDGSTDSSLEIATAYAAKYARCVRVLRHPAGKNRGISASRNLAIQHARGEFIAFLDADDVLLPHHFEAQLRALRKHPEAAMVYGAAERWTDTAVPYDPLQSRQTWWGQNYTPPMVPPGATAGLLKHGTLLRWFLEDESMVPCICTVLVRREAVMAVKGFENLFRGLYDDQVFHAKLSLGYLIYANNECVARYRQHGYSCCAGGRADIQKQQTARAAFREWLLSYASSQLAPMCEGADLAHGHEPEVLQLEGC